MSRPPRRSMLRRLNELGPGYDRIFPELTRYEDPRRRADAIHGAHGAIMQRWSFWVFLVSGLFFGMGVGYTLARVSETLHNAIGLPRPISIALIFAAGVTLGFLGYLVAFQRPMQRYFRERLNRDGLPTCVGCGYNVQGSAAPRCPECGRPTAAAEGG